MKRSKQKQKQTNHSKVLIFSDSPADSSGASNEDPKRQSQPRGAAAERAGGWGPGEGGGPQEDKVLCLSSVGIFCDVYFFLIIKGMYTHTHTHTCMDVPSHRENLINAEKLKAQANP